MIRAYGRYVFFLAKRDRRSQSASDSSTLMVGVSVGDQTFFRLVDRSGKWPVFLEDDHDRLSAAPSIARLADDSEKSLFRLTVKTADRGGKTIADIESTYVVAVAPVPHIVIEVDCMVVSGGGICDSGGYTSGDELVCDWSRSLRDYQCASTRTYADWLAMPHPAQRRFTLIGDKKLPVTKSGMASFGSLQELDRRLRSDREQAQQRFRADPMHPMDVKTDDLLNGERVMVDGIGILEPLLDVRNENRPLYAAPGRDDDMELRVYAFPNDGEPIVVPFHKLVDGHEPIEEHAEPKEPRTAIAEDWSVKVGEELGLGTARFVSITLYDGKARGVFWLAWDESKPHAMSTLRIASDVGSSAHCFTFFYPASASSFTMVGDHADVMIEPHSRRGDSGELTKPQDGDPPLPCHVRGTVTWDHEKGFFLALTDVPCQPGEERVGVVIDAHGHLSAAPLREEKDQ